MSNYGLLDVQKHVEVSNKMNKHTSPRSPTKPNKLTQEIAQTMPLYLERLTRQLVAASVGFVTITTLESIGRSINAVDVGKQLNLSKR